ncbi:TetR/AcrR family transcriptional regulator [Thermoflavimicrobium daqui]|jgi:AcrR family transcriptional regulator|uniref:HTH tetR-type domain-containing protein n=1 Tax=Thermoflavimicrobium daqui TaxID=2137476 RepID=A0A364K7M5_9BACL|nr:TetR/AcrR family transcriptional regulator [Thermoflavimicrobium daqui]RAL26278.1 hypothetical protein DL897_04600 [Thermoflavimicrobium daqui]
MTSINLQIPKDKREKIYLASLKEFAEKGYDKASTNQITQAAGISKGLLFHYFKNKKNLYLHIFDQCLHLIKNQILLQVKKLPTDLFDRLLLFGKIKIDVFTTHPLEYRFLFASVYEVPDELRNEIKDKLEEFHQLNSSLLFSNIDRSNFRPGINQDKTIQTVFLLLEAVSNKHIQTLQTQSDKGLSLFEDIYQEITEVCEILKYGIYQSKEHLSNSSHP